MRKSSFVPAMSLTLGGLALGALLASAPLAGKAALAAAGEMLVVTGDGVNVRFGPNTNTRIRQRVARGQQVMELQREGEWLRVEIVGSDGSEGWIHSSLLAPPGAEALAAGSPATGAVQALERPAATATAAPAPVPPAAADEEPAFAAGQVVAITPEAATTGGETLPAVGRPALPAANEPAAIAPAAAPQRDDSAEVARFRQSVDYLNSRAVSVAGVDLFTDVESAGSGVVQVAATKAWSSIPPAGQESYANTLLDRWAAARGYGGRASVQIVAPDGQVLLERSRE